MVFLWQVFSWIRQRPPRREPVAILYGDATDFQIEWVRLGSRHAMGRSPTEGRLLMPATNLEHARVQCYAYSFHSSSSGRNHLVGHFSGGRASARSSVATCDPLDASYFPAIAKAREAARNKSSKFAIRFRCARRTHVLFLLPFASGYSARSAESESALRRITLRTHCVCPFIVGRTTATCASCLLHCRCCRSTRRFNIYRDKHRAPRQSIRGSAFQVSG